ncbi:hypothetical protein GGF31_006006 [Allomyces arbusculus]|nr:hypothetical protein GGF31_006006 [Allomyces arbusculus]
MSLSPVPPALAAPPITAPDASPSPASSRAPTPATVEPAAPVPASDALAGDFISFNDSDNEDDGDNPWIQTADAPLTADVEAMDSDHGLDDDELARKVLGTDYVPSGTPPPWRADSSRSGNSKKRKRDESKPSFVELVEERLMDSKRPPWAVGKTYSDNLTVMLHEEIIDFVEYIQPTKEEHFLREIAIASVRKMLLAEFPNAEFSVFGSFQTMLYLPHSDIDMALSFDESRYINPSSILSRVDRLLRRSRDFTKIEFVRSARVPIVKAVHAQFGFAIDISVNQKNGHHTVKAVQQFMREHAALRPLTLVLKMFMFCRELNEVYHGGVSSYTIITMILSMLQTHPLLVRKELRAEENLGVLLLEWLELYGVCFDHRKVTVISDGFRIKDREAKYFPGAPINPMFLSIRDPTDTSNDLARGSRQAPEIIGAIRWAYYTLTIAIARCHALKRKPVSLLSLILAVDPSILEARQALLEIHKELDAHSDKLIAAQNKRRNDERSARQVKRDSRAAAEKAERAAAAAVGATGRSNGARPSAEAAGRKVEVVEFVEDDSDE